MLLSTSFEHVRMGHCLALGVLPKFALHPNLNFVITSLIEASKITQHTSKWAESRRDAVKALTSVADTMADNIGHGTVLY